MKKFDGLQKWVNHRARWDNEGWAIQKLLEGFGGYYVYFLMSDIRFHLTKREDVGV